MSDLQKQHDELRAAIVKARERWTKAAKGRERTDALTEVVQACRRLFQFESRNQVIREED